MNLVAPSLTSLIGERIGARLISHAGSLTNLSKYPASTVQILGAEKALFRALKTKGNTPKYGLIYHSSFIGRANAKHKGRISRYLANKCSIASRIDCFSDAPVAKFGEALRAQVEERLNFFETGAPPTKNSEAMRKVLESIALDDDEEGSDDEMADAEEGAPAVPGVMVSPPKKEKKKRKAEAVELDEDEEPPAKVKKSKEERKKEKAEKKEKKEKKAKKAAEEVAAQEVEPEVEEEPVKTKKSRDPEAKLKKKRSKTADWANVTFSRLFRRAAEQQGGLLNGNDPTEVNLKDPIRLFIVQLGVIMLMTQLLSLFLGRIRQPKVIAEVLGGIILGPTAMGRIPGFTEHVFPEQSRPFLALVANIGLVLFLFLVGLEIDIAVIKRNAKTSLTISAGGMILPFALGAGVAVPLYKIFIDPAAASFGHFLLFVGVAYSITAFPVLCRILVALKLLDTTVGIVVLSAGVGNDVVGWTLLALTVALVNASTGLTALYVLLCAVGWTLFILYPVKRGM
ncbi:K(+)/H(+) antiporter, partial [Ceratobasidium sp. 392]